MQLNAIFSDGVVFQQNRPIAVFGEAHGVVTAEFLGETRQTTADGRFCLTFCAHPAGGPYRMTLSDAAGTVAIEDVWIGEVVLLAGQSNAELTVAATYDRDTVFPDDDAVRLFPIIRLAVDGERRLVELHTPYDEKWNRLTADTARDWSAIALHTARQLRRELGVTVGVVGCYQGASVIESFLSEAANRAFDLDPAQLMSDHFTPEYGWNAPACLFHAMLEKVIPFSVGAVVWYQGESNRTVYEGKIYDQLLCALIAEWRSLFRSPELPFVVVQIHLFPVPPEEGVIAIREAQERAVAATERCELVRIGDLGESEKIHPENKREVSERIFAALMRLRAE